jgi:hypothetical protein
MKAYGKYVPIGAAPQTGAQTSKAGALFISAGLTHEKRRSPIMVDLLIALECRSSESNRDGVAPGGF